MASNDFEVVVVGGGAAGIGAAARLIAARVDTLIVESRPRLGGRSWTVTVGDGFQVDLGCGWLHSVDRNPWRKIAEIEGHTIDSTVPSWTAPSTPTSFPPFDEAAFMLALHSFRARLEAVREQTPDRAAGDFLEPQGRWNRLLNAVSTFYSGAELDRLSVHDFARYEDTNINWRVLEGFGTVIAAYAADLPVKLACLVRRIDRGGRRLRLETTDGVIAADAAIITLPSNLLAEATSFFTPALPEKAEAASGLPLGLADKLFLSLSDPREFERDTRLFGRTDRTRTGRYHFRPFGRPMIEAYFGGELAADLEVSGDPAFLDFAMSELVGVFGSAFASRLGLLKIHRWGADPYSHGSYSYALPGKAECRTALAKPIDERLFFAGEACSRNQFSTAHGAYFTGIAAAEQAIAALRGRKS